MPNDLDGHGNDGIPQDTITVLLGKDKLIFGGDDVGVDVKVLLSLSLLFE
jgi:hypothetical protein